MSKDLIPESMCIKNVPLSPLFIGEGEIEQVIKVLKSGKLREGGKTREFEEAFRVSLGGRHAIATSSGTAALHLSFLALIQPGDEVLVPAFTFIATASMVVMAGGVPVFCDIDPKTWTIDPKEIERKITPKTRAIAGVHLFGNACDMATIEEISERYGLKIIWDAAQSLGTTYRGKQLGNFRDAVCFSFYPTKNITVGEGGMIVTNDDQLAVVLRRLKEHGRSEKYLHQIVGLNYRMTELEAAIGLVQLNRLDEFLAKRKKLASIYLELFDNAHSFSFQYPTPGTDHSYNYFSIAFKPNALDISRDDFARMLLAEGIQSAVHYPRALHDQPCFTRFRQCSLPVSESLASCILSLPMSPFLSEDQIHYAARKVIELTAKLTKKTGVGIGL